MLLVFGLHSNLKNEYKVLEMSIQTYFNDSYSEYLTTVF